jgi:hypothetical protein
MAHALELPGSDDSWTQPLPVLPRPGALRTAGTELRWLASFLGPWVGRRLRGVSSGTGRAAKRPALGPFDPTAAQ